MLNFVKGLAIGAAITAATAYGALCVRAVRNVKNSKPTITLDEHKEILKDKEKWWNDKYTEMKDMYEKHIDELNKDYDKLNNLYVKKYGKED